MKKIKFLLFIIILLLASGCFNYRELDQLALESAIGIDKTENGYLFTVQVMNTKKSGADSSSTDSSPKFLIFEGEGKTIQEATDMVALNSPKELYREHLQLFIIGEELAKSGIKEIIDLSFRKTDSRKQFLVAVAKNNTANNVLKTLTPLETINAKNIYEAIETNEKDFASNEMVTYEEMLGDYLNSKIDISIPVVILTNNDEEKDDNKNIEKSDTSTRVKLDGTAYFKDDKLVNYLSTKESKALNYLKDNVKQTTVTAKCDNKNYFGIQIFESSSDVAIKDNKLVVKIDNKAKLIEINCQVNLEKEKEINKLENDANIYLENLITTTFKKLQKDNSDAIGLEDSFYKYDLKKYKEIKNNWQEYYKNLEIDVKVDTIIKDKGNTLKVIKR